MKRYIILVAVAIMLVLLLASPYLIDNISATNFENNIENKISVIENTTVEQIYSFCGNTAGTGNRTDIYVCVLVKTALKEDKFEEYLNDATVITKVDSAEIQTSTMSFVGIKFENAEFDKSQNYYIVEYFKKAPCSGLDMRGY